MKVGFQFNPSETVGIKRTLFLLYPALKIDIFIQL